jgi:hypothetical protein
MTEVKIISNPGDANRPKAGDSYFSVAKNQVTGDILYCGGNSGTTSIIN